jgi:peptide/nickel transport system substrate-binding protein
MAQRSERDRSGAGSPLSASRRRFLRGVGVAAAYAASGGSVVAALQACAPVATVPSAVPSATPKRGGTVIEGGLADPQGFNQLLATNGTSQIISRYVFEPLILIDSDNKLVPGLAETVPDAPDGKTYSFKLRKDLKWSDGRPITSEDVSFTFQLLMDPAYTDFSSVQRGLVGNTLQSVQTPDPLTVIFTTKAANAGFLANGATLSILPKHILGTLNGKQLMTTEFNTAPQVASGVFKFVKWDKGQEVRLARNDSYWAGPSYLDTYVRKVLASDNAVATQLRLGEIDMGQVVGTELAGLKDNTDLNLVRYVARAFWYYQTQVGPTRPFADKAVRQALRWAIDVEKIKKVAFADEAQVMSTHLPSWSWAADKNPTVKYSYDPDKAKQLLDSAGWRVGSSGIREKGGRPLMFVISAGTGQNEATLSSQILQEQWKAIGADVEVKLKAAAQLSIDTLQNHDFDVLVANIATSLDPDFASQLYQSAGAVPGGANRGDYKNPTVDKLFDDARSTTDQAKRTDFYRQLQQILLEDLPLTPLVLPLATMGLRKRVNGVKYSLFADAGQRPWMKDVWVPDGK